MVEGIFENSIKCIVQPHRVNYKTIALGQPPSHTTRTDILLHNSREEKIALSIYRQKQNVKSVIICLHGISGCRLDFTYYQQTILSYKIDMITFDFSGSGKSEGQNVTLGFKEKEDLKQVYMYVKKLGYQKIYLFGRSMGAVTAILFLNKYFQLKVQGLILDSPYYSFYKFYQQYGSKQTNFPSFLIRIAYHYSRNMINWRYKFDIQQSNLQNKCDIIKCPVVLIYSRQDQLINCSHSIKIYQQLINSKKKIILQDKGKHNGIREQSLISQAIAFVTFQKCITIPTINYFFNSSTKRVTGSIRKMVRTTRPSKTNKQMNEKSWIRKVLNF